MGEKIISYFQEPLFDDISMAYLPGRTSWELAKANNRGKTYIDAMIDAPPYRKRKCSRAVNFKSKQFIINEIIVASTHVIIMIIVSKLTTVTMVWH